MVLELNLVEMFYVADKLDTIVVENSSRSEVRKHWVEL